MPTPTPAIDYATIRPALASWVQQGSQELDTSHVIWDHQGTVNGGAMPRPSVPYAELSMIDINAPAHDYITRTLNVVAAFSKTITAVSTSNGNLTIAAHGFGNGDGPVQMSETGGALPTGFEADTDYYVIVVDANTIRLAATFVETGGITAIYGSNPQTPIVPSTAGSGTLSLNSTDETVKAGAEILKTAQGMREVTVRIQVFGASGSGSNPNNNDALRIITNIVSSLPLYVDMLDAAGIGLTEIGVTDIQSAAKQLDGRVGSLLEPRAVFDLVIYVGSTMTATEERVDRVSVTAQATTDSGSTVEIGPIWAPSPPE